MIWIGTTIKWLVSSETDLSMLKKKFKRICQQLTDLSTQYAEHFPYITMMINVYGAGSSGSSWVKGRRMNVVLLLLTLYMYFTADFQLQLTASNYSCNGVLYFQLYKTKTSRTSVMKQQTLHFKQYQL